MLSPPAVSPTAPAARGEVEHHVDPPPQLSPVPRSAAGEEEGDAAAAALSSPQNQAAAEVAAEVEAGAAASPPAASPEADNEATMAASEKRVAQRRAAGQRSSPYVGVYWLKSARAWTAELTQSGQQHRLGVHTKEEDAARASVWSRRGL